MSADFSNYRHLTESFPHEMVTQSHVEDIQLPGSAGTLALIRLDNHEDKRPNTLGPGSLIAFGEAVSAQYSRAESGEISALGVTGKPGVFAAGADIVSARELSETQHGIALAELGHTVFNLLEDFPLPTFGFINGSASAEVWRSHCRLITAPSPPPLKRLVSLRHSWVWSPDGAVSTACPS